MHIFRGFNLMLYLVISCRVSVWAEDETCEKSGRQKRSVDGNEANKDSLTNVVQEFRKNMRKYYTEETDEYATSSDGWLEIYRRQQNKKKVGGCQKLFLSHKEIKDLVSFPTATFFSRENFEGDTEAYDFKLAKFEGGCQNLEILKGNKVRSVQTQDKCVRLFGDPRCRGLSLAFYPGSETSHQNLPLTQVNSIGPCLEEEFLGSFFQDQAKSGISKRRSDSVVQDFPDLAEFYSSEKFGKGRRFPRSSYLTSRVTVGPKPQRRVEFLYANILPKDLPQSRVSFDPENSANDHSLIDKQIGDVLGFGISPILGGPPDKGFNIFPQSPTFQKAWALQTSKIQQFLQSEGTWVEFSLNFVYQDESKTRPFALYFHIYYHVRNKKSKVFYGRLLN